MKVKLDAEFPQALKIASVFPNAKVTFEGNMGETETELIGLETNKNDGSKAFAIAFGFSHYCTEIILDLSKNQPCIYACMREGFKVETVFNNGMAWNADFTEPLDCAHFFDFKFDNIKSIEILCIEEMEGVEVVK